MAYSHREIQEERKSGKIIGEIRIGPKRYYCALAALNIGVPPLFLKKSVIFIKILQRRLYWKLAVCYYVPV